MHKAVFGGRGGPILPKLLREVLLLAGQNSEDDPAWDQNHGRAFERRHLWAGSRRTLLDLFGSRFGPLDNTRKAGSFVWFVGVASGVYVTTPARFTSDEQAEGQDLRP
jgi:hypothetical protein